jgi:hypothetical protein
MLAMKGIGLVVGMVGSAAAHSVVGSGELAFFSRADSTVGVVPYADSMI